MKAVWEQSWLAKGSLSEQGVDLFLFFAPSAVLAGKHFSLLSSWLMQMCSGGPASHVYPQRTQSAHHGKHGEEALLGRPVKSHVRWLWQQLNCRNLGQENTKSSLALLQPF